MSIVGVENVRTLASRALRKKASTMRSHTQISVAVEIIDENKKIIGIKRFVIPSNYKIVHLVKELRSKMGISPVNTCHLLLKDTQKPMMMSQSIEKLHCIHKGESGFVYLSFVKQGVFGCCPNYKSPQHDVNPFEAIGFAPPPLEMMMLLDGVAMGTFEVMDEGFIEDQSPWDFIAPSATDHDHDHNYVVNSAEPSTPVMLQNTAGQLPNTLTPSIGSVLQIVTYINQLQNVLQNLTPAMVQNVENPLQNLLSALVGGIPMFQNIVVTTTNQAPTPAVSTAMLQDIVVSINQVQTVLQNLTPAMMQNTANHLQNLLSAPVGGIPVLQNIGVSTNQSQNQASAPVVSAAMLQNVTASLDQLQSLQAGTIAAIPHLSPLLQTLANSQNVQAPLTLTPLQSSHQTDDPVLTSTSQSNHIDHSYA